MKYRIFHGPVNIAGFGRHLADWQRKQGAISDFVTYNENPLMPNSHHSLQLKEYGPLVRILIQILFFLQSLLKYNLFHFYFGWTLLPFNLDLPFLRLFRKKIVMTYCGSDIRLMEIERKRNPYWELLRGRGNDSKYDWLKKWRMRWERLWVNYVIAPRNSYAPALTVFPNNRIVKDIWIHNIMDITSFKPESYETKTPPLLVHAPSHKGVKGTAYIERSIDELRKQSYSFKYLRIEDSDNSETRRIIRDEADIIIDQLVIGAFGTFAVEGMFFGKPVVGYLIEDVMKEHYPDCPIVNVTIENITDKLAWLIDNPTERVRLGREGRTYVERYFDSEKVNKKLWSLYQSI